MTDASKPLRQLKQEKFVQYLMAGMVQAEAYEKAGYIPNEANASRLKGTEKVKLRLQYLQQMQQLRKGITVETICAELDEARAVALAGDHPQPASAIAASMGKAKLMGLLVERKESGKPGDFNSLSIAELRKQLADDLALLDSMKAKAEPVEPDADKPLN